MGGGEENASRHRCEDLGTKNVRVAGNVITTGSLLDSLLMEVSSALLRGIWRTFSIASLTSWCLYPLFIRCVVSALERV